LARAGAAGLAVPFQWSVAIISTIAAVGGFMLGFSMYRNLKAGEVDPLAQRLGPVFTVLQNKYYVDEFYQAYIIRPVVDLATWCAKFDYDWVINPIVNAIGLIGRELAEASALIDRMIVDGLGVTGISNLFRWFGKQLRMTQTGQAQNYIVVLTLTTLSLVGAYLILQL
jgi:NADH-quinone oxidoreductase subunit L